MSQHHETMPVPPAPVSAAGGGVTTRSPAIGDAPLWAAAAVGLVATGVAIATGELLAGVLAGVPSPILSVGRLVVDLQPPGAKEFVVSLFGTADKLALEVLVLGVALLIGAGLGVLARRRSAVATAVLGGFVIVGLVAGLRDPGTQPTLAVIGALVEFLAGATVLSRLAPLAGNAGSAGLPSAAIDWSRRTLLIRGGALAVGSLAAGVVGRALLQGQRVPESGSLPVAGAPAELPAGADLGIDGLTPVVVPNADFYRIDTALLVPNVDRAAWKLRIHGMVDHEVTLDYAALQELEVIEQFVTIACVSNRVGGDLIGNAKWTGVRLRDVLDMAGVQAGATQLVGRSVDGFTAGMPVDWIMDPEREPMIALGMNDAPLPREHGYPARLIVPGLFGYVSATKWLSELELTTMEAFDGYWVPLGWAKRAPILTQSRIDRPRGGGRIATGHYTFAGLAWAPDRGISKVEVRVDDGEWRAATTSTPISDTTWLQWEIDWDATAGDHQVSVRATDGTGATQPEERTRPDPDGARGWHTVPFSVG